MLPQAENELLTATGPGTPMGNLMRRYWIPALLSEEIPEPDCPPVQVRLLGEELVAFRDSQGRVGLLDEHCSHRGTSLYYGRNEECGLRCIYHGWKYDVEGKVLETPAEPADSNLRHKVRHKSYPCAEMAGMVYAYLGPKDQVPLLPNYEWSKLPRNQIYVKKAYQNCNYLQGLEGECDSSHLSYLHRALTERKTGGGDPDQYRLDGAPRFEVVETDYGVRMLSVREGGDGTAYLRVSNFVMPFQGFVPTGGLKGNKEGYTVHIYVPADDTHTWRYMLTFKRNRSVREEEKRLDPEIGPDFIKVRNIHNHYLQDRNEQRHETFIGIGTSFMVHDACATETMGPVYDRSREHLGRSDTAVIQLRKFLLDAVRRVQQGKEPPHMVRDPEKNNLLHIACIVDKISLDLPPKEYVKTYIERRMQEAPL